jgi:diguanylate cyclase (GGDEF)-like protein
MAGSKKSAAAPRRAAGRGPRTEPNKALTFLARLATEFTVVLSLPDLLEHVMQVLHEETGFDSCSVALADERIPDALIIRAASGLRASSRGLLVPRGKGLYGAVMATGTPLLIPDMADDPRVHVKEASIRSGIYAPLTVHGRATGVLSAHRLEPNAFTEADLNLLTVVARYLAGAVEVARLHEQLRELAATDALTGLANRRSFLDRLTVEMARLRRAGGVLSVAILDLNGLKVINDTHGHAAGDGALTRVAQMLTRSIRVSDLAARFGGDEFTLLLPDTTKDQAEEILQRIGITRVVVPDARGGDLPLTFSWGISTWPDDGADAEGLLQAADARLYMMKLRMREEPFPPPPGRGDPPLLGAQEE